jgi:hypothetical protein
LPIIAEERAVATVMLEAPLPFLETVARWNSRCSGVALAERGGVGV